MSAQKDNDATKEATTNISKMMFDQMKRLSNPDLDLEKEIKRSHAMATAGNVIINAAKVQLDAVKVARLADPKPKQNQKTIGNGK